MASPSPSPNIFKSFLLLPPLSRSLLTLIFVLSLSSFIVRSCVAPHNVEPFWAATGAHVQYDNQSVALPWLELQWEGIWWRPWTLVTMAFFERGFISLAISMWFVAYFCPALEKRWGARELGVFILFVTGVSSSFLLLASFIAAQFVEDRQFYTYWNTHHGSAALRIGLLVADAQFRPDTSLLSASSEVVGQSLNVTMKTLPLLHLIPSFLLLTMLSWDLGPLLPIFGFYFSWFYLRFIKTDPETGLRGDRRQEWEWADWFAFNQSLHKFASVVGNLTHFVFRTLRIVPNWETTEVVFDVESLPAQASSTVLFDSGLVKDKEVIVEIPQDGKKDTNGSS